MDLKRRLAPGARFRRQRGFTLVEAIVAGVLAVVMSGIVLSYFYFNVTGIRQGSAMLSMERAYDVAAQTIGARTREAAAVLADGENFASRKTYDPSEAVYSIKTFNANQLITGGFRIVSNRLEELDTASGNWNPFLVGGDTIKIASGSSFSLDGGRLGLRLNLVLTTVAGGKTYTLTSRGDRFRCRNAN